MYRKSSVNIPAKYLHIYARNDYYKIKCRMYIYIYIYHSKKSPRIHVWQWLQHITQHYYMVHHYAPMPLCWYGSAWTRESPRGWRGRIKPFFLIKEWTNCINRNAHSTFSLVSFWASFRELNVDQREVFSANHGRRLGTITGVSAVVRSLHLHSRIIPRIARPRTLQSSSAAVQLG